jgi:MraZ protein
MPPKTPTPTLFLGEYHHALDDKGRIAVPVKFRSGLGTGAVVTRGLDRCLYVYPVAAWGELATKLMKLPLAQAKARAFARLMLAGAMALEVDRQGRALLPDYLRRYAGLKRHVVFAGLANRAELWDRATWERERRKSEAGSAEIAEALGNLGI